MKRRLTHQTNHPFDQQPFEAFWSGSWKPVEQLTMNQGIIWSRIIDNGDVIEQDIPISSIRVRSRKATSSDCITFLRPGVDLCVLSTLKSEDGNPKHVWMDARLRSIERKPHDSVCDCLFHVSFYVDQGPDLMLTNKKINKETSLVNLGRVSILQKLEQTPCENQFYRWSSTEDCFSVQARLFSGKFSHDLSWLAAASLMRQTSFSLRSLQNRLVYEVSEHEPDMLVQELALSNHIHTHTRTLSFKEEKEVLTPVLVHFDLEALPEGSDSRENEFLSLTDQTELRRSKRRNVKPERYLACDKLPDYEIELTRLGESKTYSIEYDDVSSDDDKYDDMPLALSVQAHNNFNSLGRTEGLLSSYKRKLKANMKSSSSPSAKDKHKTDKKPGSRKRALENELAIVPADTDTHTTNSLDKNFRDFKPPRDDPDRIEEMVSRYFSSNGSHSLNKKKKLEFDFTNIGESSSRRGPKLTRRKYHRAHSLSGDSRRDCFYVRESIYDVKSFRKGSVTARLCRELIRRCMDNIDATLRNEPVQQPALDQWNDYRSTNLKEGDAKPANDEEELSEADMLWKEMAIALTEWYFEENEESHHDADEDNGKSEETKCEHEFVLNEQVGTVCRLCRFVETDIKDILPPFATSAEYPTQYSATNKDPKTEEDENVTDQKKHQEIEEFCIPTPIVAPSNIVEGQKGDVWALIPELKDKLRTHQKKAFEFLWRNIAGSLSPARMEEEKKRGGCVISHTPGAGKTLLVIAFLVSYLKLFPGSRPLVLAPKTTLYTWYKEIIKWKVPIPVYQIHGGQTYKSEVLKQKMKQLTPGMPRNQDVMHVLDCLEKMQSWLSHPSILLMGYTSFLTLTREDSHYAHRKYMAQLLKQCPGILILDEGHNPRSTKSRLRKGLMKVNTRLRVLLSGTLFQNNFGEYFNTLCLARPSFVTEVLRELDPKYEKRNKQRQTQFSLENRGRKLLIDKISRKIDSNEGGERAQALKTLKKLTSEFIDVYEGGSSEDKLPGLQCYTLMMKSTSLQQDILFKLQHQRPVYKGFPLELELLITLGAIHPWLIRTTACSKQYFTNAELENLEQFKFDTKCGSKVRFVMNLIPRCLIRNEKVLIFCHNISPINLFLKIFEKFYGWKKGREVLVLQGDIELFERGRVMDKFEEPGGASKVMLASITACAEGISLTAASRVILLDSEWNPSKSKQAIARAFRPGQNKVVYVYQMLAKGTLEEEKHSRTTWKEWVSDMIFSDEHVEDPSHWQAPKIEDEMLREIVEEDRAALFHRIMKNEKASNVIKEKV